MVNVNRTLARPASNGAGNTAGGPAKRVLPRPAETTAGSNISSKAPTTQPRVATDGGDTTAPGIAGITPHVPHAPHAPLPAASRPAICIFSGGTAANSLVDSFQAVATHLANCRDLERATAAPGLGTGKGKRDRDGRQKKRQPPCPLTYIIPTSDNGGSSSELIRFFGGPSVGDIRSRLVRLVPRSDEHDEGGEDGEDTADDDTAVGGDQPRNDVGKDSTTTAAARERAALRALFEHRLCASDPHRARIEWLDLVEARHLLWTFVPSATRELVRAMLNTLNMEIVKRARPTTSVFNFAGASVGNLFLTGARLFSGSFEAAIYLLSLICGIPAHVAVLPAISSNFTHHISAGLANGSTIAGQVNISHPSAPTSLPDEQRGGGGEEEISSMGPMGPMGAMSSVSMTPMGLTGRVDGPVGPVGPAGPIGPIENKHLAQAQAAAAEASPRRHRAATAVDFEDATLPGSLPVLRRPQISFSKDDEEDLPARIARIWYINPYGHEIRPQANAKALAALRQARVIIYSIGSLYTSIVPSLVLRGVGAAIRGVHDDDDDDDVDDDSDGPSSASAAAVLRHHRSLRTCRYKILILNSKLDRETGPQRDPMTAVDFVRAITAACKQSQQLEFDPLKDAAECQQYVTHLIYLAGAGSSHAISAPSPPGSPAPTTTSRAPRVDVKALRQLGIQCIGVPRQSFPAGAKADERYETAALTQALNGVVDGTWDRDNGLGLK